MTHDEAIVELVAMTLHYTNASDPWPEVNPYYREATLDVAREAVKRYRSELAREVV